MIFFAYGLSLATMEVCGVYLVVHDHVTLGGWVCILAVLRVVAKEWKGGRS